MYPFNDENYFFQTQSYPYIPYSLNNQNIQNKIKLKKTMNIALRSISTINQIIPIIIQVRPLINNTKNGLFIMKALKHMDELNLDEITDQIHPIESKNQEEKEEYFENML